MSVALAVAKLIELQGFGTFGSRDTGSFSINVGEEPDKPDDTITIYDTGGDGPDTDEMDIDQATIQIRVRSHIRYNAALKIKSIRNYLMSKITKTYESRRFFAFIVTTDVAEIGRDDNKRCVFTLNMRTLSQEE